MTAPSPAPTPQEDAAASSASDESEQEMTESSPPEEAENIVEDGATGTADTRPRSGSSLRHRANASSRPQRDASAARPPPPPPPPNDAPPKEPNVPSLIGLVVRGAEYQAATAAAPPLSMQRSLETMPRPAAASGTYPEPRGFGGRGADRRRPAAEDPAAALFRRTRRYPEHAAESSGRGDEERSVRRRALHALLGRVLGDVSSDDVSDGSGGDGDGDDDTIEPSSGRQE